jgi:uncharacterized protein YaiL (DUF2058 family)
MSLSLREQLLAAGLGTKKQAKEAERQERQRHQKDKAAQAAERERAAQQARAAKIARDQELNRQRQLAAEAKARAEQVKQLIMAHRLPKLETDEYFNFIHRQKVRRICVDDTLRTRIINGEIVLVRCEGKYEMIPAEIAEKIRALNPNAVVELPKEDPKPAEDDPYKDFVVPDDLKW